MKNSVTSKKVFNNFRVEDAKNFWIDKFICLRSKTNSFKCKIDDESKNKVKGVLKSQSKHIKLEEYKIGLDGEDYRNDCDNYKLRSVYLEIYLQKTKKINIISIRLQTMLRIKIIKNYLGLNTIKFDRRSENY